MKQASDPGRSDPVPIVDITPFTVEETRGRADVAGAVRTACEEIGFFVIAGHGFPEGVVTRVCDISRAFFDLPTEEKNEIGETGPVMGGLMHFGLGKEALAATLGGETIPDLKETLDFGPGFFGDRWPMRPPDLEPAWRAYYEAMSTLAATLRTIFATALGLAPGYFEDKFRGHLSSLRDRTKGLTGNVASEALERAGLTCNKNGVPGDPEPPQVTSGLRFGVSAGTTRGFREAEFASIGQWIGDVLDGLEAGPEDNGAAEDAARANVTELCGRFPIYT